MIRQGEIYWVDLGSPVGSAPGYLRPFVVIQNDLFNSSPIQSTVVCTLTANLRRAKAPGNVLLEEGETDLPERNVVNVSQLLTVSKEQLVDRIGALSDGRLAEVLRGVVLVLAPKNVVG
jgi:mRNA interferase MazF